MLIKICQKNHKNFHKNFKKFLAYYPNIMYTNNCCGMIALKREVAAGPKGTAGFPWSECQEAMQMAKEPDGKSLYKQFVCNTAETRALSVPDIRARKSAH